MRHVVLYMQEGGCWYKVGSTVHAGGADAGMRYVVLHMQEGGRWYEVDVYVVLYTRKN